MKKNKVTLKKIKLKIRKIFKIIGPGVITGAADDDPSGIATYSQTGAQFGYGQLWTILFTLPFLTAIQEACARIGAVTGQGLSAVIKKYYTKKVLFVVIFLVLIANIINIGADIGAMAAALRLVIPINFSLAAVSFAVLILLLEILTSYRTYASVLKWLALALLAYPITVFLVHQPWQQILAATITPHLEFNFAFFFIITGVLGTTISPYMFFWEASQEVEEEKAKHLFKKIGFARGLKGFVKNLRWDNFAGMLFSQIVAWSIIVVAATILNSNNVTNIVTAADAARALEPLVQSFPNAGFIAKLIFSIGIIGLGLLAVPVLSGSASYALSEVFGWRNGLNLKFKKAHGFYSVIIIATLVGLLINFIGINPMKALVFTAVFNGVVSVPLIFLIARIAHNKEIMGEYRSGPLSNILVWGTFLVMTVSAVAMFIML